jgi:hypothetical protein
MPSRSTNVTLIAKSDETISGLQSYLLDAGVPPQTTRSLQDAAHIPSATTAAVIFPDGFEVDDVVQHVRALRRRLPRLLLVVVTSSPQSFRPALEPDDESRLPVVLPKPVFGWTILDAIRDHVRSEPLL